MTADSPYRSALAQTRLTADSAHGPVRLLLEPRYTQLALNAQVWTFSDDHLTITWPGKRRAKRKSLLLRDAHLYVARAWPTDEYSVWVEYKEGVVQRLFGLRPVPGLSEETFVQGQKLEQLAIRLQRALQDHSEGTRSFELGQGHHRVLGVGHQDHMVLFARPLFRERPRRLIELHRDASVVLARRRNDRTIAMQLGIEVIASGDRIQFCQPDGQIMASIYLPWIGAEARAELTRRFRTLVAPVDHSRSHRDSELSLNRQLQIISNP